MRCRQSTSPATGETVPVGTANADAADDPAIWHNAANPAASLIVGTDKKAGLYVYGMDGKVKASSLTGRYNNVALHAGDHGIVVIASDRSDRCKFQAGAVPARSGNRRTVAACQRAQRTG